MSKIFFDHLIEIEHIKMHIDNVSTSHEEKTDLWNLIDEYVNKKILILILEELDEEYHDEFMNKFLERPYDLELLDYLDERLSCPFCDLLSDRKDRIIKELEEILEFEAPSSTNQKKRKKKK